MNSQRETELKPCPFCGGEAMKEIDSSTDISWSLDYIRIECDNCEAQTRTVFPVSMFNRSDCDKAEQEAILLWNTRQAATEEGVGEPLYVVVTGGEPSNPDELFVEIETGKGRSVSVPSKIERRYRLIGPLYTAPQPTKPAVPVSEIDRRLNEATRQYRHNDDNSGSPTDPEQGFVIAYDRKEIDKLVALLTAGQGQVKAAVPEEVAGGDVIALEIGEPWAEKTAQEHIADGWNACRSTLLATAPQPGEGE